MTTSAACGLCDRPYWTVQDSGHEVSCRQWTVEECRDLWARQAHETVEKERRARVASIIELLGIAPKPPRPRPMLGESLIDKLKRIYRIEDILSRVGVNLTRVSGTIKCPLHNERNGQAFSFSLTTQKWKCWGKCAVGGDVIDLVEQLEKRGLLRL